MSNISEFKRKTSKGFNILEVHGHVNEEFQYTGSLCSQIEGVWGWMVKILEQQKNSETVRLLEENMGKMNLDSSIGKNFLDMTPEA